MSLGLVKNIVVCLNLVIECRSRWPNFDVNDQRKQKIDIQNFYNDSLFVNLADLVSENLSMGALYNYIDDIKYIHDIGVADGIVEYIVFRDISEQDLRFDFDRDDHGVCKIVDIRSRCSICFGADGDVDECNSCDAIGWL